MNKGYRSFVVLGFILFELVFLFTILTNITTVPAYIEQNGEMILFASIVFNMLILGSLIL